MAEFVIECPSCGKYATAKTALFGLVGNKINCSCGYEINVKTDKCTSRECHHCGNQVVYDQSKGEKATCPVCKEPINTMADNSNMVQFGCKQCGIHLNGAKSAATVTCPVCDCVNDVAERAALENHKKSGLPSTIKYEGDNQTLIWKHPLEDFAMGSQLIVHESQEAVFFKDGAALDTFGPGRHALETQNIPMLSNAFDIPMANGTPFHSEVYYINLATQTGIKWGTDSKVRLFDPASGLHLEIGAGGSFNIKINNGRKLLSKLVGTEGSLTQSSLLGSEGGQGHFRTLIMTHVKSFLAQTIKELQLNILEIDAKLMELSDGLRVRINEALDDYGVVMPEFFVSRVVTPDDDPNFRQMKEQYAKEYLLVREEEVKRKEALAAAERKAVEAETKARMEIIGAQGGAAAMKIKAEAEAESYRMKAAAEAAEMQMKGYTYQQETSRQIGLEAMQNGITGGGSGGAGALGEVAGLGMAFGTMGGIMNMTKEAMNPMMETGSSMGQNLGVPSPDLGAWSCGCGAVGMVGAFCPTCGSKKPEPVKTWDCSCGQTGISGNFCSGCGGKKPEETKPWDCSCGQTGITGNFCSGCGGKKPEEAKSWDCACGQTGISGNFCSGCGGKKPEESTGWDCSCGKTGIEGRFCSECGKTKEGED